MVCLIHSLYLNILKQVAYYLIRKLKLYTYTQFHDSGVLKHCYPLNVSSFHGEVASEITEYGQFHSLVYHYSSSSSSG